MVKVIKILNDELKKLYGQRTEHVKEYGDYGNSGDPYTLACIDAAIDEANGILKLLEQYYDENPS